MLPSRQADPGKDPVGQPPEYSAFSPCRRRFILIVITVAGFFGPLAGGIYLPALPVLEREFHASATAINITVSVFMLTFAFGVSYGPHVLSCGELT
jgi:MFS family permease